MQVELVDIECAIRSGSNVLLSGADAVSRTAIARFIHEQGTQGNLPMIVLGGRWPGQPPNGSTLFIEELTALDGTAQNELMRLLSNRRFDDEIRETRIISATGYNQVELMSWPFNPDLFYRLNIIHIALGDQAPVNDAFRRASVAPLMLH